MSGDVLVVLYEEHEVARIHRDHDRLRLVYDPRWRADARFPISVSMPLASAEHHHEPVEAFIDNLLPDNDAVRERWGQRFQVSPRNPFKLIEHVGEECAGAFSFVGPARVAALTTSSRAKVRWLSEDDVADRLRALRDDASAWRLPSDTGQFSLAGAQPKIALIERRGRWGVPTSGATPTTHILKPPMQGLHGHVENEHFWLS